jgi:hypothetical protein
MRDCGNDPVRKPLFRAFIAGRGIFPGMRHQENPGRGRRRDQDFSGSRRMGEQERIRKKWEDNDQRVSESDYPEYVYFSGDTML